MNKPLTLALLALAPLAACSGLETGNGRDAPILISALTAADVDPVDQGGTVFALGSVRANVERIDIDLPAGTTCAGIAGLIDGATGGDSAPHTNVCASGGGSIRLNGPWILDLLAGTATPPVPVVHVPAGTYRRIDVRFATADPDDGVVGASDPLADQTLVATGTAPLGGGAQPFELVLDFTEDARFESSAGVALVADEAVSILLELDPSGWFAALPLAACAADGDLEVVAGVLLLSDGGGACSDVENVIKDAIKASGELAAAP